MNFDLALVLVVLTALSGAIWLIDKLAFAPKRAKQASTIEEIAALSEAERNARMLEAMREPVLTEYARSFFPVLLLILIFRSFIAEPFKIPSGSMMPTRRWFAGRRDHVSKQADLCQWRRDRPNLCRPVYRAVRIGPKHGRRPSQGRDAG